MGSGASGLRRQTAAGAGDGQRPRQIARNGPVAVRQAKQAMAAGCRCHWQTGWPLRLKPITRPSRPKTDVKEWPPLTRNARPILPATDREELCVFACRPGRGQDHCILSTTGFSTRRPPEPSSCQGGLISGNNLSGKADLFFCRGEGLMNSPQLGRMDSLAGKAEMGNSPGFSHVNHPDQRYSDRAYP